MKKSFKEKIDHFGGYIMSWINSALNVLIFDKSSPLFNEEADKA